MKKFILFTMAVWILNIQSAQANIPEKSCIVAPEDTKASILGIVEYKKESYAQYEKSITDQIRNIKLSLFEKNILVEFDKTECLEDALLSISNLNDHIIKKDFALPKEKRTIIIGVKEVPLKKQHSAKLEVLEVSGVTLPAIDQFLKN